MDFAVLADHRVKLKESEKKDKYLGTEETVEHGRDGYTNYNWCFWYSDQKFGKRSRRPGNKRSSGDNPNDSIIEIGPNSEKSPGDFRKLVVT